MWRQDAGARQADGVLVVVEKLKGGLRLAAVSREGLDAGLCKGLTLADARARAPDIEVVEHDPAEDARMFERLADDCERFSPVVMCDAPDGLLLDITGCAHLFGGERELRDALCRRLHLLGFHVRATIAGTPDAARALARFARLAIVADGDHIAETRRLPVAALGVSEETRIALFRAGLKTIGDLADRPRLPLSARFGEDVARRLRRMFGQEATPITPRQAAPTCMVERRFGEPVARIEDIEATLGELAQEASVVLARRREGGRKFEASFFRSDGKVRRIAVETGRAMRDPEAVLRLYRERLDALADPIDPGFGFDLIRLSVPASEPLAPAQTSLDGRVAEEGEIADLVDRLCARFGRERVQRFTRVDTHDPARASRLVPAGDAPCQLDWGAPEPGEPPARPLHLFDPPQPIDALAEIPDGPPMRFRWRRVLHDVAHAEGPERIAPEWWRRDAGALTRDYFRVEDEGGRRFWLFREGLYDREAGQPRWFLHGLFP